MNIFPERLAKPTRENVRFTPHSEELLLIGRRAGRESAITDQFPALGSDCRKTCGFLAWADASLIGGLMAIAGNDRDCEMAEIG
jgi:hypothetical protein